jgi:hypothetical protein
MKKVHSSVWADLVEHVTTQAPLRSVIRASAPSSAFDARLFDGAVLDGPFAESKEGCAHVAILARIAALGRRVH